MPTPEDKYPEWVARMVAGFAKLPPEEVERRILKTYQAMREHMSEADAREIFNAIAETYDVHQRVKDRL